MLKIKRKCNLMAFKVTKSVPNKVVWAEKLFWKRQGDYKTLTTPLLTE